MIAMKVEDAVTSYVKPGLTKKSTSGVSSTFEFEDGTLSAKLEPPKDDKNGGAPASVDFADPAALQSCSLKSWNKSGGNANVKHSQTFGKLSGKGQIGYNALLEHANLLAKEVEGN